MLAGRRGGHAGGELAAQTAKLITVSQYATSKTVTDEHRTDGRRYGTCKQLSKAAELTTPTTNDAFITSESDCSVHKPCWATHKPVSQYEAQ